MRTNIERRRCIRFATAGLAWATLGFGMGPLGGPSPASAQCVSGVVSDIRVVNHSIFDPASLPEDPWVRWAYRIANRIHVRTRPRFIERELLVQRGDCADPERVRESARLLREFRFIATADVVSAPQADGTRHLLVETRDEWTTKLSAEVEFREGQLTFGGGSITEENFLGRGITLGLHTVERDARRDSGIRLELPRVLGTGWGLEGSAGTTRVGTQGALGIVRPFPGEAGTFAFRQELSYRSMLFSWVVPPDPSAPDIRRHLALPLQVTRGEISAARRFGRPGRLFIVGGGVSAERIRTGTSDQSEWILNREFDHPTTPPPEFANVLFNQQTDREAARIHFLIGIRRFEFETRASLDAVSGVQDVPVGRELLFTVAPSIVGTNAGDVHLRADLFAGRARPGWVGQFHTSVEGRIPGQGEHQRGFGTDPSGLATGPVRHLLAESHGFLYLIATRPFPQTLVFRGTVQGGTQNDEPFQLTLGGPDGVRSLREGEDPGEVRLLFTVENRVRVPSPFPDLFDLGVTGFADLGRVLPGDSPFAVDSGWKGALGGGLRFGFPAGSAAVVRLDVAFPVGPGMGGRAPVLIVQAREWVGILGSFRSLAMEEARRTGTQPRFPGVGRAPILR